MAKKKTQRTDAERRIRQADRLGRILKILELIQGHGRWNAAALAAQLECSDRTVHRYLDVLKYAGIPYWFDQDEGCYRVRPDFKFPVLNLTEDELLGQAVATVVSSAPGLSVGPGAEPTTRKLSSLSDNSARKLLDEASQLVSVLDLKLADHSRHQQAIHTIQWALLKQKQLSGQYVSPYQSKPSRLTLHPYRLCLVRQAWYLIARASKENEAKTYRVPRFQTLRMLDAVADVPENFDLKSYFGNAWSIYRGAKSYDVEIRFAKEAATQVTETKWHHTQQAKRHRDGSVTLSFNVDGLEEILWWLLAWTGFAKVVRPAELRKRFVQQLRAGLHVNIG